MCFRAIGFRLSAVGLLLSAGLPGQRFLPDDPVQVDPDHANIAPPRRHKLSDYYDFFENSFGDPGDRRPRTAMNINTLGEAPDSSWFTNRHARRRMSIEELARGPNRGSGPAPGTWYVLKGKNEGVTPGFSRIRDSRGDLYAIKFDPRGNLEMATSADMIGSKFFHAMGYHVPEYYIVYFRPEQLELGDNAIFEDTLGRERKMDRLDIQEVLRRVARAPDGRYRGVASRILEGEDLGPFRYYGTRSDDANDIFPHEHRRELRGLWVLSAWLNHDDSRSINTLNMLVKQNGRQFIRHHLIDFGSILGSGSVSEQKPRAGNEYLWEAGIAFRRMLTFGFWDRDWILIRYPRYPSIGKFEAQRFRPERWKPEYPNAAFLNCLPEDAYWAAKIVMSFTDQDIGAIIRTGQLSDKWAEEYLAQCVIERRDKVGRYWMNRVHALDRFEIDPQGRLRFEDLAVGYGFTPAAKGYSVSWYRYDNQRDRKVLMDGPREHPGPPIPIPEEVRQGSPLAYFSVAIRRVAEEKQSTRQAAHLYFRRGPGRLELVGVEREE